MPACDVCPYQTHTVCAACADSAVWGRAGSPTAAQQSVALWRERDRRTCRAVPCTLASILTYLLYCCRWQRGGGSAAWDDIAQARHATLRSHRLGRPPPALHPNPPARRDRAGCWDGAGRKAAQARSTDVVATPGPQQPTCRTDDPACPRRDAGRARLRVLKHDGRRAVPLL